MPAVINASNDESRLVSIFTARCRRVNRHNDPPQWRTIFFSDATALYDITGPQRARDIVENLGVELLPTKAGAFVLADDLIEKGGRQKSAVLVSRPARYERP